MFFKFVLNGFLIKFGVRCFILPYDLFVAGCLSKFGDGFPTVCDCCFTVEFSDRLAGLLFFDDIQEDFEIP